MFSVCFHLRTNESFFIHLAISCTLFINTQLLHPASVKNAVWYIKYHINSVSLACVSLHGLWWFAWCVIYCHVFAHDFYSCTLALQRTTQSLVQMGRQTQWRHCSPRLHSLPFIVTPQDPNALETPWRNGSQAPCAASAMAAISKSCPASRSRREMAARALTWDHPKCRMTLWRR